MAASDTKQFPVKGVTDCIIGVICSTATGNPITGGLSSLAATISKDGGAFASTTSAPTEIGTTGFFTLNLSATEMNCNIAAVQVTAGNANAHYFVTFIRNGVLTEVSDNPRDSSSRLEQLLAMIVSYLYNKQDMASDGAQRLYDSTGASVLATWTESSAGGLITRNGAS